MRDKKAFEMTFSWLFALIAGAVIIILAVYASLSIVKTKTQESQTEGAYVISNYLNPISNALISSQFIKKELIKETRIYLSCMETSQKSPNFGRIGIRFAEKSGIGKKWNDNGLEIGRYNKYVFGKNISQGKKMYLFSKPFLAGFRVDDIIVLTMDQYCFVSSPESIKKEIELLNPENINVSSNIEECPKDSNIVCFGLKKEECDVVVYPNCQSELCDYEYEKGKVEKNGESVNYYGNLIYGAIFSDKKIYECNVARLGKKTAELAKIYSTKLNIVSEKGCNSLIGLNLKKIEDYGLELKSSNLNDLFIESKSMDNTNDRSRCPIY
jgi:hypothetical protein